MPTFKEISRSLKYNIGIIITSCILATILIYNADFAIKLLEIRESLITIPLILTIGILILYGLSRLIGKKYNWIITLIGIILMFYISLPIFFGAFK